MTDLEERLRHELRAAAERAQPMHLRPLQARRVPGKSGSRRWLAPVAAVAAVAVVVGGLTLSVHELQSGHAPVVDMPSHRVIDPPAFAGEVLSSADSAWIKMFSPVTGRVVRSVAALGTGTGNGFALSPDSRSVYLVRVSHRQIRIERISVATGRRSFVAVGEQPAVSPDGQLLAYATGRLDSELAVRNLSSGRTRTVDLTKLIGSGSSLLGGQVAWLGSGSQVVAIPSGNIVAQAARGRSAATGPGRFCASAATRLCLVVVDLSAGHIRARRIVIPGLNPSLMSGDLTRNRSLLMVATRAGGPPSVDEVTISGSGASVRHLANLPRGALAVAFAPAGDRILYLAGHRPVVLWVATIRDGGLADVHRLFADSSKGGGFDLAAW